ncbi:hypothetical protein DYU05_09720 [Mucilaginibacter terrenus]|uniref:Lipocalin-like domain-containing protein n=1 Tax=Mucilaginibacter terrenus TaxID=2482727 RepID=A0A3E2NXV0_9SPHI|nr:lipocalin family protein [Mucilaginibacter terrenus]RFZ85844.1 hypothetical protein DYU05_09720 [Mucilaginibacter terrenus]
MKTLVKLTACLLIVLLAACTKEKVEADKPLAGTWQLNAAYTDPGDGSGKYVPVSNPGNNKLTFKSDGKLEVSGLNNSDNFLLYFSAYSTYTVKDSTTLVFKKQTGTDSQNFIYKIEGDMLTLSPAGPLMCIEGCGVRFIKED